MAGQGGHALSATKSNLFSFPYILFEWDFGYQDFVFNPKEKEIKIDRKKEGKAEIERGVVQKPFLFLLIISKCNVGSLIAILLQMLKE